MNIRVLNLYLYTSKLIRMLKLIAKLFGSKSEKDIKRMTPMVEAAKSEAPRLESLSHDELRQESLDLQAYIQKELEPIDAQLRLIHEEIAAQPDMELPEKEKR